MDEKLLTIKEAVKFLCISIPTLNRIKERKEIGFYQIGRRIVFSKENHLIPYLQKSEQKPQTEGQA